MGPGNGPRKKLARARHAVWGTLGALGCRICTQLWLRIGTLVGPLSVGCAQDLHRICVGFVKDLHPFGGICVLGWVKYLWENSETDGIRFPPLTPYIILN